MLRATFGVLWLGFALGCAKDDLPMPSQPIVVRPTVTAAPPTTKTTTIAKKPPASTSPFDEAAVPLYPGAKKVTLTVRVTQSKNKIIGADYSTPDSPEKVRDFYVSKLGLQSASPNGGKLIQILGRTPNGGFVQVIASPKGKATNIAYYATTPVPGQ